MVTWAHYRKVALDTNCFIYLIEGSPYGEFLLRLFTAIEEGEVTAVSSAITIAELLTGPAKTGDTRLWEEYRSSLYRFPHLVFRQVDLLVAEQAAILRGKYGFKTPDSLQLSTAIVEEADLFITHDAALNKCDFPILQLSDRI